MADFAKWAMASMLGQGSDPAQFVADFATNIACQNDEALNASTIGTVLLAFLADRSAWAGAPHELYAVLKQKADDMRIPAKSFPGSSAVMSKRLREIRPNLAAIGWELEFVPGRDRKVIITRNDKESAVIAASAVMSSSHDDDGRAVAAVEAALSFLDPWDGERT